jgi:hypothetical protein
VVAIMDEWNFSASAEWAVALMLGAAILAAMMV